MKIIFPITTAAVIVSTVNAFVPHTMYNHRVTVVHSSTHQEQYDAEEEAAFDAHDLSDAGMEAAAMERAVMVGSGIDAHDLSDAGMEAAAMERAVMVANDMVKKKGTELKQKAEGLQIVERQYVMMKKAAVDLANFFKYYEEDPSSFRTEFASQGKDEDSFAIEMLEKIIATTAEEMLKLEREELFVISSFFDTLHQEELEEARKTETKCKEDAAATMVKLIEEYDGDERMKDTAIVHANGENEEFDSNMRANAILREHEHLLQEFEIKKQLEELQKREETFKADLQQIQKFVRDQLHQEWNKKKEGQKS